MSPTVVRVILAVILWALVGWLVWEKYARSGIDLRTWVEAVIVLLCGPAIWAAFILAWVLTVMEDRKARREVGTHVDPRREDMREDDEEYLV